MSNFEDTFGAYTREQLQKALRSIDPEKNPEDYAAVKAELARALPAFVGESCLDVGGVLLPMASFEESQRVAELVTADARSSNHPLVCRAVRVSLHD